MPKIFTCEHCSTSFSPSRTGQVRRFCGVTCFRASKPRRTVQCFQCNSITFNPKFCSPSCRTTYCNKARGPRSLETRSAIRATIKFQRPKRPSWKDNIAGPYSTVYRNTCCKTNKIFYSSKYQKYHPSFIADRKHYAYLCRFQFSISKFPEWFDGRIIQEHGWYSTPGSRSGKRNLNGVSRDHKLSVDYGYKNNIPPSIIAHPANCELVLHKHNQNKHSKSSITHEQLLSDIQTFNSIYTNWQKR